MHFNRQPGVADAAFAANTGFLRNLYRTEQWLDEPAALGAGMPLINMAKAERMPGRLMMSEAELGVFVDSFERSGFTGGINWYRNFTRNWETTRDAPQRVDAPTLMIYGQYDMVQPNPDLGKRVTDLEVHTLPCGHWIQQEQPEATTRLMLDWLARHPDRD
ncbi:MAG: alpha/beta hydrolase [Pseudomonadales bacterium]